MKFIENINIFIAVKALDRGKLVIVPTETVYGIVGNSFNRDTYFKLNNLKKRDPNKKYTLFVKNSLEIEKYAIINDMERTIINKMMPGPLTFVLKAKNLPDYLISDNGTIAFRIPANNIVSKILHSIDFPLLSTSANISEDKVLQDIKSIKKVFGKEISVYVKGSNGGKLPSTVISINDKINILRRGPYKATDFVGYNMKITIPYKLRILFVCYANIVRSPIAEYYFKSNSNFNIKSAGVGAKKNNFPTKEAIEVAKTIGVDITSHLSKPLTKEDILWADFIFATDNMVRADIYDLVGSKSKVFLISDFSRKMKGELIPDPYKYGIKAYRKMIALLKYHLDEVMFWLKSNIEIN